MSFKVRSVRLAHSIFVPGAGSSQVWTANGGSRPGDCAAVTLTPHGHFIVELERPTPRTYFVPMTSVVWADVVREADTSSEDVGKAMDAASTAAVEAAKPTTKAKVTPPVVP